MKRSLSCEVDKSLTCKELFTFMAELRVLQYLVCLLLLSRKPLQGRGHVLLRERFCQRLVSTYQFGRL
jgi:hypothetical protein